MLEITKELKLIKVTLSMMLAFAISLAAYADDAKKAGAFTMTSTSALDQGTFPILYTCDGKDISPEIAWTGQPANTQSYALIVNDPDAPGGVFYHWVVYNLPKTLSKIDEGMIKPPAGALVGKNSYGKLAYNGPCPPKGGAHTYIFTLYALDGTLSVPAGADAETVLAALGTHTLGKATFSVNYSR